MEIVLSAGQVAVALSAIGGAIITAATLGAWVVRPVRRLSKGWAQFHEDWHGEPARPGVPERPGMMQRMADVEGQLKKNGGKSLRDSMDRVETGLARVDGQLTAHIQAHTAMADRTS